jgi:esterase/lipase
MACAPPRPFSRRIDAWRWRFPRAFFPSAQRPRPPRSDRAGRHADYELFPTRAVAELNALMRHARRHLAQIDVPLLLIFARHDRVVPLDTLDYIWPRVASADKQQVILERGGHIVTEDYDKEIAFAAIERFLQQRSPDVKRRT